MATEREKMAAGQWYTCEDPELEALRTTARDALSRHNAAGGDAAVSPALARLFAACGTNVLIETPFHCNYAINIALGDEVFINAGCAIVDTAPVTIGDGVLIGPHVQIYCAEHHQDPVKRRAGLEIARPVTIGANAWIGGAAVILPGVTVGENAIVGAGSVVTRDVPPNATVVGNPARPIPRTQEQPS